MYCYRFATDSLYTSTEVTDDYVTQYETDGGKVTTGVANSEPTDQYTAYTSEAYSSSVSETRTDESPLTSDSDITDTEATTTYYADTTPVTRETPTITTTEQYTTKLADKGY